MKKFASRFLVLAGGICMAMGLGCCCLPFSSFSLETIVFGGVLATVGCIWMYITGDLRLGDPNDYPRSLPNQSSLKMETGGVPFSYDFQPRSSGKNSQPSRLTIAVAVSCGIPFVARRRKKFDSFGEQLGLSVPLITEDDSFNQQIYIETNYIRAMEHYLAIPSNRQALLEILDFGFENISCSEMGMKGQWTHYQPETRDMLADLNVAAQGLTFLAQGGSGIPDLESIKMEGGEPQYLKLFKFTLFALLAVVMAGSILGLLVDFHHANEPLRYWDLFSLSLQCLVIMFPSYLVLTYYYLRGRSTSHHDWFAFGLIGLVVQAGGIPWTLHLVNVLADTSPQVVFKGKIQSLPTHKNKKSTSYSVQIPSRTTPLAPHTFSVSDQEYHKLKIGDPFELITRPGRLGIEWVVSFKAGPQ